MPLDGFQKEPRKHDRPVGLFGLWRRNNPLPSYQMIGLIDRERVRFLVNISDGESFQLTDSNTCIVQNQKGGIEWIAFIKCSYKAVEFFFCPEIKQILFWCSESRWHSQERSESERFVGNFP